jgi:hypothetical protein
MTTHPDDAGVIQTLLDRFNTQRLPRVLKMKEIVDRGETLEESEVKFLVDILADIRSMHPLLERHPECAALVAKALGLYKEITQKALTNETGK